MAQSIRARTARRFALPQPSLGWSTPSPRQSGALVVANARRSSRLPIGFIRQIGRITGAEYPIRDNCAPAAGGVGAAEVDVLSPPDLVSYR